MRPVTRLEAESVARADQRGAPPALEASLVMDYRGRESFNHPLLIVAAALAGLAVASGGTLWFVRLLRRVRRDRPSRA